MPVRPRVARIERWPNSPSRVYCRQVPVAAVTRLASVSLRRHRQPVLSIGITVGAALGVLATLVGIGLHGAEVTIGGAVVALVLVWTVRHPAGALGALVVYVPLQTVLLAWLYRAGAPEGVVRNLGFLKEAITAGLLIAAVRRRREWGRADALDFAAMVYLAIPTVYYLLPFAVPGSLGGASSYVRLAAWRLDCLFVVLFLVARRLDLRPETVRRLRAAVIVVGLLMVSTEVWEVLAQSSYNNFFVKTVGVPAYRIDVLGVTGVDPTTVVIKGSAGETGFTRNGGILFDSLAAAFLMLLPLGLALERLALNRFRTRWLLGAMAAAVGVTLTFTRSAILGGVLAMLLAPTLRPETRGPGRQRLGILLVVAALLAVPIVGTGTLQHRFASILGNTGGAEEVDTQGHIRGIQQGIRIVIARPLGLGLGANPTTGGRYGTSNAVTTEDSYLQVGAELGVLPMVAFICLYSATLVRLRRRSRAPDEGDEMAGLAGAMWLAGLGLLVTGFFLHVWTSFPVALGFWGLAGVAIGSSTTATTASRQQSEIANSASGWPPASPPRSMWYARSG